MTATEFKGPIVEGAYYEREDGAIGRAESVAEPFDVRGDVECNGILWKIAGELYVSLGTPWFEACPEIARRVYITHTDPVEVVAELREMAESEWHADEPARVVLTQAADLVEEKLVGAK